MANDDLMWLMWLQRGQWVNVICHLRTPREARTCFGRILRCDSYGVAIRAVIATGSGGSIHDTYIPWGEIEQIVSVPPLPLSDADVAFMRNLGGQGEVLE
jgi:hypothetical protein